MEPGDRRKFLAWLDPAHDGSWLDVGCGTGAFTELVLRQAAPKNVTGIDPSPAQVEHACKAVGLRRPTRLTFRRTHSAWAHDKGIPPKVVAANMGQPRSDTTINVYAQVLDGAVRDAADRVGSELFTIFHNQAGATALTD